MADRFVAAAASKRIIVEGYLERLRERAMAAWHGLNRKTVSPTA